MIKITAEEWRQFAEKWWLTYLEEQRFGQAIYNHFRYQLDHQSWPELFYHGNKHWNDEALAIFQQRVEFTE